MRWPDWHWLVRTAAVWIGLAVLTATGPWQRLDERSWDHLSVLVPPDPAAAQDVVIVAIDEPSFADLGLRWPWPRSLHATLIERLHEAGAKVVGLDIIFAEPSSDPSADASLAAAVAAFSPVVMAAEASNIPGRQVDQEMHVEALPAFLAAGARSGDVAVPIDPDGSVRRLPAAADSFARVILGAAGLPLAAPPPAPGLMRFFAGPHAFTTVSYYQALEPDTLLPARLFRDKLVLVGFRLNTSADPQAPATDSFITPLMVRGGGPMAGVELQATTTANLLHGLAIRESGTPSRLAILALVVLAAALVLRPWSPSRALGLVGFATLAALAVSLTSIARFALWIPPLPLFLGAVLPILTEGGVAVLGERRARREIKDAFGRYLSPDLVEILARDPGRLRLGGERRTMTFLFCDIRGFTSLSETLEASPERLTQIINRFLTAMSNEITAERGTIDKFMGDCVMAFWNAPLDEPLHATRACRCALAMLGALGRLNAELTAEGVAPLRVGIGINTGECLVGNMGSADRFAYSAMGDPVNLASRLEGLSARYGMPIILGEATVAALDPATFAWLELERVAVKGKAHPVTLHTLLGDGAMRAGPAFRTLLERHAAFLAAWRAGDPVRIAATLRDCEATAPPAAGPLYRTFGDRLALSPPVPGGDGIVHLDTK